KAAIWEHELVQGTFPGVTKRWMSQIVRQTGRFNEIGINGRLVKMILVKPLNNGTSNLGHFKTVSQTGAVEVVFADQKGVEDLGFSLESTQCRAVQNAIA